MLIDDLKSIQDRLGYLSEEAIREYSDSTNTPLYRIQAVASFYPHFRLAPPPRCEIRVCTDLVCHMRGAAALYERLSSSGRPEDELEVHACSCLGQCDNAPAILVDDHPLLNAT